MLHYISQRIITLSNQLHVSDNRFLYIQKVKPMFQ